MPILTLVALVLPLGLDAVAVSAAIGRLPERGRWRISVLFLVFEPGMPLTGVALGAPVAHAIGDTAAVIAIGAWMLLHGDADDEEEQANKLIKGRPRAVGVVPLLAYPSGSEPGPRRTGQARCAGMRWSG